MILTGGRSLNPRKVQAFHFPVSSVFSPGPGTSPADAKIECQTRLDSSSTKIFSAMVLAQVLAKLRSHCVCFGLSIFLIPFSPLPSMASLAPLNTKLGCMCVVYLPLRLLHPGLLLRAYETPPPIHHCVSRYKVQQMTCNFKVIFIKHQVQCLLAHVQCWPRFYNQMLVCKVIAGFPLFPNKGKRPTPYIVECRMDNPHKGCVHLPSKIQQQWEH